MSSRGCISEVLITALLLSGISASTQGADRLSGDDWLRGAGKELQLCLKGEVFGLAGQAAKDIQVDGGVNDNVSSLRLEPTVSGNKFEVWIPLNQMRWHSMWLMVTSANGDRAAYKTLNAFQLRQTAIDGMKLSLRSPSRHVEAKVVSEGQPVPEAIVKVDLGFGLELRSRADANGVARFGLLPEHKLSGLTAWTGDYRIGGFSFNLKPTRDPGADEHVIELTKCRDQKLRFIDENRVPASDIDFVIQMATAPPDYNFIGTNEHSHLRTDAAGEAIYKWFPEWDKHYFYTELNSDKCVLVGEPETVDDTIVFKVTRTKARKFVDGRVVSTSTGVGGFYVSLWSFQGEREGHADFVSAFTNRDGSFSADVLPDATYCAYALDARWVGKIIDLIPYQSAPERFAPLELSVSEGQPVEVIATTGPEKKPYSNLSVSFKREHRYTWREDGQERSGISSPQWWTTTDESGRATTHTLPGKLTISVYTPLWRTEKTVDVNSGSATRIELHREVEEKRRVTGRLVIAGGRASTLKDAEIRIGSVDGTNNDEQTLTCRADGSFSFETFATEVGVLGCTTDGHYAGSLVVKELDSPIEVQLKPTQEYQGQLLGDADRPLADHRVQAIVRVEGNEDYCARFVKSFEAKRIETRTDNLGSFSLRGIPSEMKVNLYADAIDNSSGSEHLGEIYLAPNELRPRSTSRLTKSPVTAAKIPLATRYESTLRDCALCGFRLMTIIASDNETMSKFVNNNFVDYQTNIDIYSFMQIVVATGEDSLDSADAAFLKERNWQLPPEGHVIAYAIDANGNELGNLEVSTSDSEAADEVAEFIHRHAPAQIDAEAKWGKAFAEAKRSKRRIWARISQRYCGPCFRMARWLDDQEELLRKDYVMLKIDDFRDQHGKDVAERLTRGAQHGVPFHAIFSEEGELLIDSAGPLGNIGHPSGFEGKKQLRRMLLTSRRNLTDAEIDQLVESVGN